MVMNPETTCCVLNFFVNGVVVFMMYTLGFIYKCKEIVGILAEYCYNTVLAIAVQHLLLQCI